MWVFAAYSTLLFATIAYGAVLVQQSSLREQHKVNVFVALLLPLAVAITYTACCSDEATSGGLIVAAVIGSGSTTSSSSGGSSGGGSDSAGSASGGSTDATENILLSRSEDNSAAPQYYDLHASDAFHAHAVRRNAFVHDHYALQRLENFNTLFAQNFDLPSFEDFAASRSSAFQVFERESGDGGKYFLESMCQRLWALRVPALCLTALDEQHARKGGFYARVTPEMLTPSLSYAHVKDEVRAAQGRDAPFIVLIEYRCSEFYSVLPRLLEIYNQYNVKIVYSCKNFGGSGAASAFFAHQPQVTLSAAAGAGLATTFTMMGGAAGAPKAAVLGVNSAAAYALPEDGAPVLTQYFYASVSFQQFKGERQARLRAYAQSVLSHGAWQTLEGGRLNWNKIGLAQTGRVPSVLRASNQNATHSNLSAMKLYTDAFAFENSYCLKINNGLVSIRNECEW